MLFNNYINDLVLLFKSSNKGIAIDEDILLYAVDIVLIAKNEENLQVMLNVLYN